MGHGTIYVLPIFRVYMYRVNLSVMFSSLEAIYKQVPNAEQNDLKLIPCIFMGLLKGFMVSNFVTAKDTCDDTHFLGNVL